MVTAKHNASLLDIFQPFFAPQLPHSNKKRRITEEKIWEFNIKLSNNKLIEIYMYINILYLFFYNKYLEFKNKITSDFLFFQ